MKNLIFMILTFLLFGCKSNSEKQQTTIVKPSKTYYFTAVMYSYPEIITVKSDYDVTGHFYEHEYKQRADLGISEIRTIEGNLTEDQEYIFVDNEVAKIKRKVDIADEMFKTSANLNGIDTEDRFSKIVEAKVHTFKTYKEASEAHRMAEYRPRDFLHSKQYYPSQKYTTEN